MKKINIQLENDNLLKLESKFSILNTNKELIKNSSNKNSISCMNSFSSLTAGVILYTLYVSLFIVGIVGAVNIGRGTTDQHGWKKEEAWPIIMTALGFTLFGMVFFVCLFRVITSTITSSLRDLSKQQITNETLDQYIRGIVSSSIELSVNCKCYHESSNTTTNSDGSTSTSTTTVITYTEDVKIPVIQCTDLTNPLETNEINKLISTLSNNSNRNFINISFYNYYMPSDEDSQTIIKSVVDHLTTKNKHRDVSFSIQLTPIYTDKKFKNHLLFPISSIKSNENINSIYDIEDGNNGSGNGNGSNSNIKIPFLFKYGFYILSLFLMMFLPYEIYFNSKIYKSKFTFIKSIKVQEPPMETTIYVPVVIPMQGQNNYLPLQEPYQSQNLNYNYNPQISLDKDY